MMPFLEIINSDLDQLTKEFSLRNRKVINLSEVKISDWFPWTLFVGKGKYAIDSFLCFLFSSVNNKKLGIRDTGREDTRTS